ncbi:hypothetical protein AB0D59_31195 [Streptomyces sp. NPDC048417]|uniref:hypothetical protein n=1 Tax=Streptomyces sp. NPDC048417 TaxID=3155387 RepID=UPI00342F521D
MPFPPPSRTPWGVRRRSLIVSAASAAVLAGCSAAPDSDSAGSGGSTSVSARARARAARDSEALLRQYDAVLAAHPALAGRLRPLRAQVAAHAAAFADGASDGATATGSPSATASASTTASASASPGVPADERSALAALAAAERGLADRRAKELLDVPGELARLLAGVSAAGSAHAYLLTEGEK